MKHFRFYQLVTAACVTVALSAVASSESRADTTYSVTLNTSALAGSSNSTFFLALELTNNAAGDNANTVTLSNFVTNGGTGLVPVRTIGGVAGDTGSTLTLSDGDFLNGFYAGFSKGTSSISFLVDETSNVEPTPDEFQIAILDGRIQHPHQRSESERQSAHFDNRWFSIAGQYSNIRRLSAEQCHSFCFRCAHSRGVSAQPSCGRALCTRGAALASQPLFANLIARQSQRLAGSFVTDDSANRPRQVEP